MLPDEEFTAAWDAIVLPDDVKQRLAREAVGALTLRAAGVPFEALPLHGITLETIIKELVERFGWAEMGSRVPIRCFLHNPSVKSSLTFLRKTPWARERVEGWYIAYKDM